MPRPRLDPLALDPLGRPLGRPLRARREGAYSSSPPCCDAESVVPARLPRGRPLPVTLALPLGLPRRLPRALCLSATWKSRVSSSSEVSSI